MSKRERERERERERGVLDREREREKERESTERERRWADLRVVKVLEFHSLELFHHPCSTGNTLATH
jgi:hypothetical protein